MITIPREICRDFNKALTREWLVTNGKGSYASSTISGARTRRYHGLLVAALNPPLGRTLLLAKIDEEVEVGGQSYRFGTNEYQDGTVEPNGFLFLQNTTLDGMIPCLYYETATFKLRKTIWMEHGRDTTYIRYELDSESPPVNLTLLPFCAQRDIHALTAGTLETDFGVQQIPGGFRLRAIEGERRLRVLVIPGAAFTPLGLWYWRFRLRAEAERGLDATEDLYLPGLLRAQMEPGQSVTVAVSIEPDGQLDLDVEAAWRRAIDRQVKLTSNGRDEFEKQLLIAADQFLVARANGTALAGSQQNPAEDASTVIAGYHWFGDWSRDTMVSLTGLTLTPGRSQVARDILMTYARFLSDGILPNRFNGSGHALEYNTVDATLWFFHAIDRYLAMSGDRRFLQIIFPTLRDIVTWHINGTHHGIHMDRADGLIYAGDPGFQLTWMDAKVGEWVVTPRAGKPVEVNALWYNGVCLMQEWSKEMGETDPIYARLSDQVGASFERYWFPAGGYLYDVIDGPEGNDTSVRPNQLFALSLAHSPVPLLHAKSVLEVVSRELLTPYGLRSLTPRHPNYRGHYSGDRASRDGAYHNGTVWPWLMGAYIDAHRRVYPDDDSRLTLFAPFQTHLTEAGLGTIGECFDGDEPYRPVACIAQAWSVAEILRAYREVGEERRPAIGK
jgi:predicted glycogen debranching enzyme